MKGTLLALALILGLFSSSTYAQQPQQPVVVKEFVKLLTPDSEVGDAIIYLEDEKLVNPLDRPYIKFFTTYNIEEEVERQKTMLIVSFLAHNMIGAIDDKGEYVGGGYYPIAKYEYKDKALEPTFKPINRVPDSKTLWAIDIRNFNWTEQAWESMFSTQGYFVEPIVTHEKNGALRLLSGNSVVRADWFVNHASAITQQADIGSKVNIYKEFLYGSIGTTPKNVSEFEKVWGIDTVRARNTGNVSATLVTKSKAVARHNRILYGYRTEFGWYYRTYDVNFQNGFRDYGENIIFYKGRPPNVFDGGEIFATNLIQMQVYDLYNAQESTDVAFGDPTLVKHSTDILNDPRVRTPHSCYDCHAAGPIPSENSLFEFMEARMDAKIYDKKDLLRIKRVFLDNKFEDSVAENQVAFAKSLEKINGLKPEENVKYYLSVISRYNEDLDLKRAAFECGVSPEAYESFMRDENKIHPNKVPMRIAKMLAEKNPERIPRSIWESPGKDGQPGLFQQSMVMIHGLTSIVDFVEVQYIVTKDCFMYSNDGKTEVMKLKVGDKVKENVGVKSNNGWIGVKSLDGKSGFIKLDSVKK